MRYERLNPTSLIIVVLFFSVGVHAQRTLLQSPKAVLQQALQAQLGAEASARDVIIVGTLTDGSGVTLPIQIVAKDAQRVRYEIGTGDSQRVSVFADNAGSSKRGSQRQTLRARPAASRPITLFPFWDLLQEINDADVEANYVGLETLGAAEVYHFQLLKRDPTPSIREFGRGLDEQVEMYLDPRTLLVVRTVRMRTAEDDMNFRVPSVLDFSDYRQVGSYAVPFRVVNTIGTASTGFRQSTWTFSSVAFDQTVPETAFIPE